MLLAVLALVVGLRSSAVRAQGEVVLLVTGPVPTAGYLLIRDRLEQRYGYTVVQQAASVTEGSQAAGKALVLISSTAPVADVGTKFLSVATPVATWNPGVFPNLEMTGGIANNDFGTAAHYNEVVIANEGHPMAAGHVGIVTVTTAVLPLSWGYTTSPNATVIATLGVFQNRLALFG